MVLTKLDCEEEYFLGDPNGNNITVFYRAKETYSRENSKLESSEERVHVAMYSDMLGGQKISGGFIGPISFSFFSINRGRPSCPLSPCYTYFMILEGYKSRLPKKVSRLIEM